MELYVHIPFCERKCGYCDFLSFPADDVYKKAYVDQLVAEIRAQGAFYKNYQVSTIFIGGGTPTSLKGVWIANILSAIYESFILESGAEITMECNPGTLSPGKLEYIKQSGVNRISFGLQSSVDAELATLGRIHTYGDFLIGYQMAREAGFQNINIDLMSGIPLQTLDSYRDTLRRVCMLKPEHISAYSLIVEENTPFYAKYGGEGQVFLPSEEADRQMYHLTRRVLAEQGYERYEISNYAKKGQECRHNMGYWTGVEYLGLGLGAYSYLMHRRFHVERDFRTYMSLDLKQDITPLYRDLTLQGMREDMEEFMFLGLRLTRGVSLHEFNRRFGLDMFIVFEKAIGINMQRGLLEYKAPFLRLTEFGLDVSNMVMSDFILD